MSEDLHFEVVGDLSDEAIEALARLLLASADEKREPGPDSNERCSRDDQCAPAVRT